MDPVQQAYKNTFEKFLAHTDEKKVFLEEIGSEIEKRGVKSLLDIGAGNGLLSIPLSKCVDRYLAIEPKDSFVQLLRTEGLETIHGIFPLPLEEKFDMVLASHSVSFLRSEVEKFVQSAWRQVAPNGTLLIVTYNGREGDWFDLTHKIGLEEQDTQDFIRYPELVDLVHSLGRVEIRKVKTTVQTESLTDMVEALSFVASNGIPELIDAFMSKKDLIEELLVQAYKTQDGFEFPFWHYFIAVK